MQPFLHKFQLSIALLCITMSDTPYIFHPADRRHALTRGVSLEGLDGAQLYWLYCNAPMAADLVNPQRARGQNRRDMRDEYNLEQPACQVLPHTWILSSRNAAWSPAFLRKNGSINTESQFNLTEGY